RPRLAVVGRLEKADALHDRPDVGGVLLVGGDRRDPEVAGWLVRRIVPLLASGLACEHRVRRPRRPVVATLEDAGRLHTDEDAAVSGRDGTHLCKLSGV